MLVLPLADLSLTHGSSPPIKHVRVLYFEPGMTEQVHSRTPWRVPAMIRVKTGP